MKTQSLQGDGKSQNNGTKVQLQRAAFLGFPRHCNGVLQEGDNGGKKREKNG